MSNDNVLKEGDIAATVDEENSLVDELSKMKTSEKYDLGSLEYQSKQTKKKRKRTRLEKWLMFIIVCFLIAVIVLAVKLASASKREPTPLAEQVTTDNRDGDAVLAEPDTLESKETMEESPICIKPASVQAAVRVVQNIDFTVKPCDNFYDFACGGWMRSHTIPSDRGNLFAYGQLRDDVSETLNRLLDEGILDDDIDAIRKVKTLYKSCMNEDLIEEMNLEVLFPLLQTLGGWPLLGDKPGGHWNESEFDLGKLLVILHSYNNQPIIPLWTGLDDKNNSRRIIFIDQTWFGMPNRNYYLDDLFEPMLKAYRELMYNVSVMIGADVTTIDTDIDDIIELETQLANITMTREDRQDSEKLYNKMTIRDLQDDFTSTKAEFQFDWLSYIQGAMQIPDVKVNITEDEEVVVIAVPYYKKLFRVLAGFPNRTIANYAVWRIMKNRVKNLPRRFRAHLQTYSKELYGTPSSRSRWMVCIGYIKATLELGMGRIFIENTFGKESKEEALHMINNTRKAFYDILTDLDWMDDNMKSVSKEKAKEIVEVVGYPEFLMNDTTLNSLYENITMEEDKYFENVLTILQMDGRDNLANLRKPNVGNRARWTTSATTVNAFYSFQRNQITFPAGILQPPYFHIDQPRSLNYGGIGFMMGHEITHGFDDTGRLYDKQGNLFDWWTPLAAKLFKERGNCLIDQYSQYVSPEAKINVNGITTQGENIADNGGIKQAFKAYRKWVAERGSEEPRLPGVNFTHNQLFFLNFAQIRCGLSREKDAYNHIMTGAHSPNRFRIIGSLQNMPEFSEAFGCPLKSTMNPVKKCSVW